MLKPLSSVLALLSSVLTPLSSVLTPLSSVLTPDRCAATRQLPFFRFAQQPPISISLISHRFPFCSVSAKRLTKEAVLYTASLFCISFSGSISSHRFPFCSVSAKWLMKDVLENAFSVFRLSAEWFTKEHLFSISLGVRQVRHEGRIVEQQCRSSPLEWCWFFSLSAEASTGVPRS